MKTSGVIIITEPNFIRANRFTCQEFEQLNRGAMVACHELRFFLDNPASPMQ